MKLIKNKYVLSAIIILAIIIYCCVPTEETMCAVCTETTTGQEAKYCGLKEDAQSWMEWYLEINRRNNPNTFEGNLQIFNENPKLYKLDTFTLFTKIN